jgi:hypothetical protein
MSLSFSLFEWAGPTGRLGATFRDAMGESLREAQSLSKETLTLQLREKREVDQQVTDTRSAASQARRRCKNAAAARTSNQ